MTLAIWRISFCQMAYDPAVRRPRREPRESRGGGKRPDPRSHVELLGMGVCDPIELSERVERGLPYRALERLRENLSVPAARLADLLLIPARTLSRRRKGGRLEPDESDRLLRLSRVVADAVELFEGDLEAARRWLSTPLRALRGKSPLDLSKTDVGAREVERLVGRLEQGIVT